MISRLQTVFWGYYYNILKINIAAHQTPLVGPGPPSLPPSLHPNRLWADSLPVETGGLAEDLSEAKADWDWLRCKWESEKQWGSRQCVALSVVVLGTDPSNSLSHPPLGGGTSGGKTVARLPLSHKYSFFLSLTDTVTEVRLLTASQSPPPPPPPPNWEIFRILLNFTKFIKVSW